MSDGKLNFLAIHTEFRPKILRYLARMVGEFDAEDLTQEVFVRVSRALHTFRGESKLSTWIYRIATNVAIDRLRSPSFRLIVNNETLTSLIESGQSADGETEIIDQDTWTGDVAPSLEQELFRKERSDCYQKYIESLPITYRSVVALSEIEDLAIGEIADILGLSTDVVKIRLHRGRTRLLKELRSHCKPEDWL